jgi:hypothetical protein
LKRWEKKYKQEFFKDTQKESQMRHEQLKMTEELILTFAGDLRFLQEKYSQSSVELDNTP